MNSKSYAPREIKVLQYESTVKNKVTGEEVPSYNRVILVKNGEDKNGIALYSPLTDVATIQSFNMLNGSVQDALELVKSTNNMNTQYFLGKKNLSQPSKIVTGCVKGEDTLNFGNKDISQFSLLFFYPGNAQTRPHNLPKIMPNKETMMARKTMLDLNDSKNVSLDDLKLLQASFMFYDKQFNEFVNTQELKFNSDMSASAGPNN